MISAAEAQVVGCPLPASVVARTEWILILVALSFRPSSALAASAMDMGLAETSRRDGQRRLATARAAGRDAPHCVENWHGRNATERPRRPCFHHNLQGAHTAAARRARQRAKHEAGLLGAK